MDSWGASKAATRLALGVAIGVVALAVCLTAACGQELRSTAGRRPFQEFYCYDRGKPRVFQRYWEPNGWGRWREHQLIDPDEVYRRGDVRVRWLGEPDQRERDRLGLARWEQVADTITDRTVAGGRWDGRRIVLFRRPDYR